MQGIRYTKQMLHGGRAEAVSLAVHPEQTRHVMAVFRARTHLSVLAGQLALAHNVVVLVKRLPLDPAIQHVARAGSVSGLRIRNTSAHLDL